MAHPSVAPSVVSAPRAHYYAGGTLNRASWLRDHIKTTNTLLTSSQARIILFDKSNPLCTVHEDRQQASLVELPWSAVSQYMPSKTFRAPEDLEAVKVEEEDARPVAVFLGVEDGAEGVLPHSKADIPSTPAYFAIDATNVPALRDAAVTSASVEAEFLELRSGISRLNDSQAGLAAEAKSLIDWNKRNRFCAGCGQPTASIWSGWKRQCRQTPENESAPCMSKKGVHNYAYPRTDSVVIMAILHPTEDKILLGRNRAWPKGFVSCLAGFLEPGESLETAVRREVFEESGVRVGKVGYHSSQPWPYPASLMLGCWGVAEPDQVIRTDLDNELEQAVFVSRDFVKDALVNRSGLTRQDIDKIDAASNNPQAQSEGEKEMGLIRLPPDTAIAHQLIKAWLEGDIKRE